MTESVGDRWPGWIYAQGDEPDYRFSFANERTYLAWVRTGLALLAAGVALDMIDLSIDAWLQKTLAVLLLVMGIVCAVAAWIRWAASERAIRRRQPLPSFGVSLAFTGALLAIGVAAIVALLAR